MDYSNTFNHRGSSYDSAMQRFPFARANEFQALFSGIDMGNVREVLDIPAGGGYLRPYLPAGVRLHEFDFSAEFAAKKASVNLIADAGELPASAFDLAVSLAAIHHIDEKASFLSAIVRCLVPGGLGCIADVVADSAEASFLDGFVARYNGSGHSGKYMQYGQGPIHALLEGIACSLCDYELRSCPWVFADGAEMVAFVRALFNLSGIDNASIYRELETVLGVSQVGTKVMLNWTLVYAVLKKCPDSAANGIGCT